MHSIQSRLAVACSIFARVVFFISIVAVHAKAEEPSWTLKHESELSIVQVGGNTESDSLSAKQKTTYKKDLDSLVATAAYLRTKNDSTETAKRWDASLRYERELSLKWAAFVQYGSESDKYAGFTQRDNTDVGGKYFILKDENDTLITEAGLRHSETLSSTTGVRSASESGRFYSEYTRQFSETVSGKFWAEYLPNFDNSSNWLLNYEPSLSVMLNKVFSLKTAYLVRHHNKVVAPGEDKDDTTFTTSLVAKF